MDTKRFAQEDLAAGMQAANAQSGKGIGVNENEEKQVKKESPKSNSDTDSGKKVAAAAGIALAGGAAVGAAAMAARDSMNPDEEDPIEATATVQKETVSLESKSEPNHDDEGQHEIHLGDNENPTVWTVNDEGDETILVNLNPNEDNQAEVEIKSLGEGQGNVIEVDLDGDLEPDVKIYTAEDGTPHVDVLNSEHVTIMDDPLNDPVAVIGEPEDPMLDDLDSTGEPIASLSNDPDDLLNDDPVVPSELDENGDLLAQEFENDGTEIDPCIEDLPDGIDDLNGVMDMV